MLTILNGVIQQLACVVLEFGDLLLLNFIELLATVLANVENIL